MKRLKEYLSLLMLAAMLFGVFAAAPFEVAAAQDLDYIERSWTGSGIQTTTKTCSDYETITSRSSLTLEDGKWYVVNGDATVSNRVEVTGETHLILLRGTLTCNNGIHLRESNTLNIYPGSTGDTVEGTGTLTANGWHRAGIGAEGQNGAGGSVTVHGGSVHAKGDDSTAAIGGGRNGNGGTVTIYDGTVNATGGPAFLYSSYNASGS